MRIYVTGASGLVGRHVVAALVARDHDVVALGRDLSRLPGGPRVEARRVDLLDLDALLPAIEDCEGGVHCAGAGPGADEATLHAANVQSARHIGGAARRKTHLRRLVAFSSAAVEEPGDTPYRRSKVGQEAALRTLGLDLTLLRPTLVLAPPAESAEVRGLAERLRTGTVWVPGGGRNRVQPVFVEDVAAAAAAAIERPESAGHAMVLAGPEEGIAHRDLLVRLRDASGGRAAIRAFPLPVMRAAAAALAVAGRAQGVRAQLTYYSHDHLYPIDDARRRLGFSPRPYADAVDACFAPATG